MTKQKLETQTFRGDYLTVREALRVVELQHGFCAVGIRLTASRCVGTITYRKEFA